MVEESQSYLRPPCAFPHTPIEQDQLQLLVRINNILKQSELVLRCKVYLIKLNRFTDICMVMVNEIY